MEPTFSKIVETVYHLPLDEKQELMNLLSRNIVENRRNEIFDHYQIAKNEEKTGKLIFSSDINQLRHLL